MSDFDSIYRASVDVVRSRMAQHELPLPSLQSPSVAPFSLVDVPRSTLTSVPDDREFLESAYFIVLDRSVTVDELAAWLERLDAGTSRDAVIHELESLDEAAVLGVRVAWV
jgi:hypothetical protein